MDFLTNIINHYNSLWLQQSQQLLALYQSLFFNPDRQKTAADWQQRMCELYNKQDQAQLEKLLLNSISHYGDNLMPTPEFTHLQQAYLRYISNFCSLTQDALNTFYPLLSTRLEHELLPNWQELLGLWLDSYEQIYQQIITTKQYQESYGELINAFMCWQKSRG